MSEPSKPLDHPLRAPGCPPRAQPPSPAAPRLSTRGWSGPRAIAGGLAAGLVWAGLAAPAVAQQQVPTPASVIGWEPGADYELADYDQILGYYRALDAATDRLELVEIGSTAEGRPMVLALISSAENLRNRERFRDISRRLALGTDEDSASAARLAAEGRAIVWIDGGLHATETAGAQFTPKLAHRLVTEESDEVRRIRERTIVLLMPVMNPDGLDLVASWYQRNLGTPWETTSPPELYQKYVGHDNNRDWFMIQQPESRAVTRQLWHVWYPQIVVNHHQTAPFPARIFIPPFADPVNPHIPPLVLTGNNLVGAAMHRRFAEEGKPGAVSRISFTQWWNGGMRTTPYFHNQVGILTEVAHRTPTPREYDPASLPRRFGNGLATDRPSTWYPFPWEGGWWRLGDAVDYMVTASMAVADLAAERSQAWLFNTWRMARHSIERGRAGDPYAYVVDLESQHDPSEAVALLETLRRGGVEVRRATRAFTAGERRYPEGAFVLPAAQPYRPYLMDLLEPQEYPDRRVFPGGPPDPPYDLAGWTLPHQMGVRVDRIDAPFEVAAEPVVDAVLRVARGGVAGRGEVYLLDPRANAAYPAVNALLGAGPPEEEGPRAYGAGVPSVGEPRGRVARAVTAFRAAGREWPAGSYVVRAERSTLEALGREHGVEFVGAAAPGAETRPLRLPRVGLYRPWTANMDEGWTRWVLERYGFPYRSLTNADIGAGALEGLDVVILAHQSPSSIMHGRAPGSMPPEYTGGIGLEGTLRLKEFVEGGGLLLTFDGASNLPAEQFGLPVRDAVQGVDSEDFFIPGSLVRLQVDAADPIAWGMPEEAAAFFVRSRAFRVRPAGTAEGDDGQSADDAAAIGPAVVVGRYGTEDLLLSGWELGARRYLADRPAVVRVPLGRGQVVMTAFRPQFRAQPRATFKLVFNALYAAAMGDLPAGSSQEEAEG